MSTAYERRSDHRRLIDFTKIKDELTTNWMLWMAPTVAFSIVGVLHVLTKTDQWNASQALIVRDEAIGAMGFGGNAPLGRFDNNDSLKRSLETILQIAKNRTIASEALKAVGPERKSRREFPGDKDIESFIDDISVAAPKGTEFGTSEVIYLSVTANKPQRAVDLTSAVCDRLEVRLKAIRNDHAKSVIAELQEKKNLADRELQTATDELSSLEQELGQDLGEMRTLAESGSAGESNLRTQVNQIKVEVRQAESANETQIELLALLSRIGDDTYAILATPNQVLESQPALRRLKDGLVDAQLRTARLRGGLTELHPRVQAAVLNEENVQAQLLQEAKNAAVATQAEIGVSKAMVGSLREKLDEVQGRLDRLAGQRAGYVNLTSQVSQRREQLRSSSVALAGAQGRQEAATASSLITRLDEPVTGSRPVGPGRKVLVLGSSLGGLFLGLSLVYLLAPWQKAQRAGRRKTDQQGRRASDGVDLADRRTPHSPTRESSNAQSAQAESTPAEVIHLPDGRSADTNNSFDHLSDIVGAK